MTSKEPIKHHYIPQFILKNFCFDENRSQLFYFNKKDSKIVKRKIKETFMVKNLYRDDINNPDEPTKIEKDLARFESEISKIITERFLKKDEIIITLEEDEKIKLFFAIMAFRSKITSNKFGTGASDECKEFYSVYQKNGDLSDFWKRNLGNVINCRSLKEICNHKGIDKPIKIFFQRDMFGYFGLYFVVAERRGTTDFIISDAYPTIISGVSDRGIQLHMYYIFPISPNRIILLAANGVQGASRKLTVFSSEVLKKPKWNPYNNSLTFRVKKVYENEVKYVNSVLINEAYEGFVFRDKSRIAISVETSKNEGELKSWN